MATVDGVHPTRPRAVCKFAQRVSAKAGRGVDCADVVAFRTDVAQTGITHGFRKEIIDGCVFLQGIHCGGNPGDVFGQIAVGRQVNILRCFQSADETERNFNIARFHSIEISNGFFVNVCDTFAGYCRVDICLRLLEDRQQFLLGGRAVLLIFVVEKFVVVRLEFLILCCLLLTQNSLILSFSSGQDIIICDLGLILFGELIEVLTRKRDFGVAIFIYSANIIDLLDNVFHIRRGKLNGVRHIVQCVTALCITLIGN